MEISKIRPCNIYVAFSIIFICFAVCFVALIHLECEVHAQRQMLQVLTQRQREENNKPRNPEHEDPIAVVLRSLRSDSSEGKTELITGAQPKAGTGLKMQTVRFFNVTLLWIYR